MEEDTRLIPLCGKHGSGKFAVVDASDFESLSQFRWCINDAGYACGAAAHSKASPLRMHRVILECPKGFEIDHINGNRLDNRRVNLRVVSRSQNMMNSKLRSNNTSGYKGVSWFPSKNRWTARIRTEGKYKCLGYFLTVQEAAEAYRKAALLHYGEYARF